MSGTIDQAGLTADLASIARNAYPPLQLLKLPFNWFAPASGGIIQYKMWTAATHPPVVTLNGVKSGSALLVFVNASTRGSADPSWNVSDSVGSTYSDLQTGYISIFAYATGHAYLTTNVAGGSITVTATCNGDPELGLMVLEIGGLVGITATAGGGPNVTAAGNSGDLAITWGASNNGGSGTWSESSGWTLVEDGDGITTPLGNHCSQQTVGSGGGSSNNVVFSGGTPPASCIIICLNIGAGGALPAVPLTSIALNGPCNILSLVSEAIDEQGQYAQSALIGQQAAAGWVRFNGQGNVWIPISFTPPMIPGYVTTSDNYGTNPILGGGFQEIEGPFHQLDWMPNQPVLYSTPQPPTAPAGYLLAFAGLNVGVGSGIGSGSSSTYAIPSAAGPIEREKKAGLL